MSGSEAGPWRVLLINRCSRAVWLQPSALLEELAKEKAGAFSGRTASYRPGYGRVDYGVWSVFRSAGDGQAAE